MATMTLKNGAVVTLTLEELAQLMGTAATAAKPAKKTAKVEPKAAQPATKAEAKAANIRTAHDAILDTKRVERMTKTAIDKLAKQGFTCSSYKRGTWVWIKDANGANRSEEFKTAKLAKGWNFSAKRGQFFRNFAEC